MTRSIPSPVLPGPFARYGRRDLDLHFHAVRLSRGGAVPSAADGTSVLVYCNRSSSWDPLVVLLLALELLPGQRHFAPIEPAELDRQPALRRLGFFAVEPGSVAGARTFLHAARAIVDLPGAVLWVAPQGRLGDPRERPPRLEAALGHLARRGRGRFVPLALEYPFWDQRLPEALARFGGPLDAAEVEGWPAAEINEVLAARLGEAQDRLAAEAQARDRAAFERLPAGRAPADGLYRRFRSAAARLRDAGRRRDRAAGAGSARSPEAAERR